MPKENSNSGDSSSRTGYGGNSYSVTGSGTDSQGNHYCNRDYGASAPNQNSYHYSNNNGSYYYSNPDGSTYYNSGNGHSKYTR
ncbi:hypothetical protein L228DRAFT_285131 [Xylona heveae TC161]|uniref:Uncharacterized protein n=1 Tax=Xylona heveae (strain CBS 132557 / TC161) TaxID=1328760 RepID=A0A165AG75_XYLHT|nr:hypothetical protein L228DRAFT_285131 [Xylona heveae TC161]KZF20423.1 hypothetical protein L228DRAFT_285131 [Xylona heveae TC161]